MNERISSSPVSEKKQTFFFFLFLFARSILVSASPHNHDWVIGARFGDNGCINIAVHARGQTRVVRRVVLAKQTRTSIDSHTFLHLPRRGNIFLLKIFLQRQTHWCAFRLLSIVTSNGPTNFCKKPGGGGETRGGRVGPGRGHACFIKMQKESVWFDNWGEGNN